MPSQNNSDFPEADNPFRRHIQCDHDEIVYPIHPLLDRPPLDLYKFLSLVDAELEAGDLKSAREYIWGLGLFLDLCMTGAEGTARKLYDEVIAERGNEFDRLLDGE